jgi:5-formyltetrahydrofolate cyclo-ligase
MSQKTNIKTMTKIRQRMKQILRQKILAKRNSLTTKQLIEKSNIIKNKLFSLDEFQKAKNILFYVSKDSEVRTHDMIKKLLNNFNKKDLINNNTLRNDKTIKNIITETFGKQNLKISVPLIKNNEFLVSEIKYFNELEKGSYNVLEPKKEFVRLIDPKQIEIVIIPGIVFDLKGYRIGYGKGYYDIFLKKIKNLKIGLAFDFQIINKIPIEDFDVKLDLIITEKRIIKNKKL